MTEYLGHPEFRAFVACWVRDRRCPLPLVDWLLERGLEAAAEAARWAAAEPDRPVFGDGGFDERDWTGPFPSLDRSDGGDLGWYWFKNRYSPAALVESDNLPPVQWRLTRAVGSLTTRYFDTAEAAVVALLAEWVPEVAADARP